MILPVVTFTVYLLVTRKQPVLTSLKAMFYVAVSSLFLPVLWYVSIWKQGGMDLLLDVMQTEFSYFWSLEAHTHNFFYIIPLLALGFLPWIVFFFFSLFSSSLSCLITSVFLFLYTFLIYFIYSIPVDHQSAIHNEPPFRKWTPKPFKSTSSYYNICMK